MIGGYQVLLSISYGRPSWVTRWDAAWYKLNPCGWRALVMRSAILLFLPG
jgi:hypothetical protein